MEQVVNYLGNIPEGTYAAIAGGLGVSLLVQAFKKWLSVQSDKVTTFLLGVVSFITVGIDYLMQSVAVNPAVLGQHTAVIIGMATLAYRFMVKPASNIIKDAKEMRAVKETVATPETTTTVVNVPAVVETTHIDEPVAVAPVTPEQFPSE